MQSSKIVCLSCSWLCLQKNIPDCTQTDKPILVWCAVFAFIICEQTRIDSTTKGQNNKTTTRRLRTQQHNAPPFFHPTTNKPTEVLMPAPSTVALTSNIKATVVYIKPIKKFLLFTCGTSVTESVFGRTGELENNVLSE